MPMTRQEIVSVLGPADDALVADIMATGASPEELRETWAWLHGDEALINEGQPLPGTRVAELIELIEPEASED
ncbi:MAG: hypothetical protein ACTHJQ_24545 [Rhizobiaceae bacterium]